MVHMLVCTPKPCIRPYDRAEVQQHDPARPGVEAVVGEVGVGLHQAELEQLAQDKLDQVACHPVAQRLRRRDQRVDGVALDIAHG
jgi:hypothetical protein